MDGHIRRSEDAVTGGPYAHREAGGDGPCTPSRPEDRQNPREAGSPRSGVRGLRQDGQKSHREPHSRRTFYISADGPCRHTRTALEREWKSGPEAGFRSDRKAASALGTRHDTEHEAGRRGKARARKVFDGKGKKKLKTVAREFKSDLTAKATDSEKAFADILSWEL